MKVLITGGSGFIGSHLTDALLAAGHEVTVIDNYATGRRDNLTPQPRLKIVEGSISHPDVLSRVFDEAKPEVVVHAAASYKDPQNWEEDVATNVAGTALVLKQALRHSIRRLVYFQTSLCYGKTQTQPITIDHRIQPESSYAISKTTAESYIALSGLDFISFRLANVFGPRNLSGPVPTFYKRLSEGKKCVVVETRRDFLFIKDLIAIVCLAIEGKGRKGYYHVSSGKDISIHDLYQEVVRSMTLPPLDPVEVKPRTPDDVPSILLDPSRTEAEFQWKTRHDWHDGVRQAVEWYKTHNIAETFTHLISENLKESTR